MRIYSKLQQILLLILNYILYYKLEIYKLLFNVAGIVKINN